VTHAYAVGNALSALGATAFTWSTGGTTNRAFLNDGRMDKPASSGGSATTTDLTIDLGAATSLVGFALLGHSMATWTAPAVTVTGADDAAMTTNAVTAKAATSIVQTAPNHKDALLAFVAVSKRYWRLRFVDSSARTLSLAEAYAVTSFTSLARLKTWGHGESEEYKLNSVETRTGETRSTFLAGPIRTKKLPFSDLNASEKAEVMAMWRATYGGASALLWAEQLNPTASAASAAEQECVLGKLTPSFDWTERDYSLFDVTALELRSLGREVGA